jgi:hypothetical protein
VLLIAAVVIVAAVTRLLARGAALRAAQRLGLPSSRGGGARATPPAGPPASPPAAGP